MASNREITYINRDFTNLRQNLVDFSKTYFPNTYNDFSPSSPGMMFMEMASYVGDVLSFYLDNQIQEVFRQYARQKENLFNLAYNLGYTPKVTSAAMVDIDFYQLLPAIVSGSVTVPDFSYSLQVSENTKVSTNINPTVNFIIQDKIDFSFSSSLDPTVVSIYQISAGEPTYYLIKKTRKAISATINTTTVVFTNPQRFSTIEIESDNIIGILDIIDSNGNKWYEVPYLAQDFVYDSIKNTNNNDPLYYPSSSDVPYLLKIKEVQRRFVTRYLTESKLQIQFGSGVVTNLDEEITPNPDNVGIGLPFEKNKLQTAFSPLNFIFTDSYGVAPSNTTLTIRYLTGGGVSSNVPQGTLTTIDTSTVSFLNSSLNSVLAQTVFNSIASSNPKAAEGGRDGDSIEELRQNAAGSFQGQLRTVTKDDYIIRALSLPSNFGSVAKAYIEPRKITSTEDNILDLYILGYDNNKKLKTAGEALKNNLKTYLYQYRIINDSINIKDAFIINIGVNFDIITLPNYNNNEVIVKCINALKDFFNINNWQINQPIILRDLYILLDKIEGVQTVKNIEIINKVGDGEGYSNNSYDIPGATINGVIYPSIDPMIFEVKNMNSDIYGRIVPL